MADFTRVGIKEFYIGASTDDKPASAPPGSKAYEYNTGALFIMAPDMSTWTAYAPKQFIADGTVAAPGLAFASDPDTGLYRVGANTIGIAAGGIQAVTIAASVIGLKYGFTETLTPSVAAAGQTINAVPSATTITAVNAQAFTGTAGHIALPAITPAANGGGITLTSLNFAQGAIANVADSEAITVKHIVMTFAAGAALETGILTQTAIDITLANQAANGAANAATGLKVTGGTQSASGTQRGIDITMAAGTHNAIYVGTGSMYLGGALELTSTLTLGNAIYLQFKNSTGTAQNILVYDSTNHTVLNSPGAAMLIQNGVAQNVQLFGGAAGSGQLLDLYGTNAASGAGNVANSPMFSLRAFYRDASNVNTGFPLTIQTSMTTGGATPAASGVFQLNSVTVLTLTNTNGTPSGKFPGTVGFSNYNEGGTAALNIKSLRQVVNLTGAQTSTTINIPSGAMLLGASFNVDTAVVTSAATNTWDADYTGGSTTNLVVAGTAGAQNTKANKLIVPEIASAQTNIEFDAPGAETFSSGAIEVVAYYIDQTSLANA